MAKTPPSLSNGMNAKIFLDHDLTMKIDEIAEKSPQQQLKVTQ